MTIHLEHHFLTNRVLNRVFTELFLLNFKKQIKVFTKAVPLSYGNCCTVSVYSANVLIQRGV